MNIPGNFRWSLFAPGERVLVAVSGGQDSLSLLRVLWTEWEARGLGGVEAAHLDHGLRGDESAAEAAWVADWCRERGVVCHLGKADTAAWAREHRQSRQEAARAVRYEFLERTASSVGADKIATGHTRDDQAETVLANILRGTGTAGLRGIPERRGRIVRPLLDVSRAEIEAYCASNGLRPRRDLSNLSSEHYTRNRIRLELLPQLRREYNLQVEDALLRLSEIAVRDSDYLAQQAQVALREVTRTEDAYGREMDRNALAGLHPALLRYVVRLAIADVRGTGDGVTYEHLEAVCRAVRDVPARTFSLTLPHPLCRVHLAERIMTVTRESAAVPAAALCVPLPVPGEVKASGWTVRAAWEDHSGAVRLDADAVDNGSLMVRNRRRGDRIDPLGMNGKHKKLTDIFSDAKVPRLERDRIPVIADHQGIVWIASHTLAERAKVTPGTSRMLFLSARDFLPPL